MYKNYAFLDSNSVIFNIFKQVVYKLSKKIFNKNTVRCLLYGEDIWYKRNI